VGFDIALFIFKRKASSTHVECTRFAHWEDRRVSIVESVLHLEMNAQRNSLPLRKWPIVLIAIFCAYSCLLVELDTSRYGANALMPAFVSSRESQILFLVFILCVTYLVATLLSPQTKSTPKRNFGIWAIFIFAWWVSCAGSEFHGLTWQHTIGACLVLSTAMLLDNLDGPSVSALVSWFGRGILIGSALLAGFLPMRAFAPFYIWPGGWFKEVDRLQGVLPHPNSLAFMCSAIILLEWRLRRRAWVPFSILACILLILTGARTESIALVATVILAFGYSKFGSKILLLARQWLPLWRSIYRLRRRSAQNTQR